MIVGRCANQILKGRSLSVFIHAPFDLRVRNVQARTGREERSARKMVKRTDKERRAYYEFFTDANNNFIFLRGMPLLPPRAGIMYKISILYIIK